MAETLRGSAGRAVRQLYVTASSTRAGPPQHGLHAAFDKLTCIVRVVDRVIVRAYVGDSDCA